MGKIKKVKEVERCNYCDRPGKKCTYYFLCKVHWEMRPNWVSKEKK